jgi:hypothetical protein
MSRIPRAECASGLSLLKPGVPSVAVGPSGLKATLNRKSYCFTNDGNRYIARGGEATAVDA